VTGQLICGDLQRKFEQLRSRLATGRGLRGWVEDGDVNRGDAANRPAFKTRSRVCRQPGCLTAPVNWHSQGVMKVAFLLQDSAQGVFC